MKFELRPVRPRGAWKRASATALTSGLFAVAVGLLIRGLTSAGGAVEEGADPRSYLRRTYVTLRAGVPVGVPVEDLRSRALASLVARFHQPLHQAEGCEIEVQVTWIDAAGRAIGERRWRRIFRPFHLLSTGLLPDLFIHPGGGVLSGTQNLAVDADDYPPGTRRIEFAFVGPAEVDLYARFLTKEYFPPGSFATGTVPALRRDLSLSKQAGFPLEFLPDEVLDVSRAWKWRTLGVQPRKGRAEEQHLLRRVLTADQIQRIEQAQAVPSGRGAGPIAGRGYPVAFALDVPGRYRLECPDPTIDAGSYRIERRSLGEVPASRVVPSGEKILWEEPIAHPSTLIVRKEGGARSPVVLTRIPDADVPDRLFARAGHAGVTAFLCGPPELVETLRPRGVGAAGVGRVPAVLGFDWTAEAVALRPLLRVRLRGIGFPPAGSATVSLRLLRASGESTRTVPITFPVEDLERLPDSWSPVFTTGPMDLHVALPEDLRRLEISSDVPLLAVATQTLPMLAGVHAARSETADRSLGFLSAADDEEDPAGLFRRWFPLHPTNEEEFLRARATVFLNLQAPLIRLAEPPDRYRARGEAEVTRHAGDLPMLWPFRPLGATALRGPWLGAWPASAFRRAAPGETIPRRLEDPWPEPVEVLSAEGGPEPLRTLHLDGGRVDREGWINVPARPEDDPRVKALRFHRGYRATAAAPVELVYDQDDGDERFLTIHVQPEGPPAARVLLQVDVERADGPAHPIAWAGPYTRPRYRFQFDLLEDGAKAVALRPGVEFESPVYQARVRVGSDLLPGRYKIRITPLDQPGLRTSVVLAASWSSQKPQGLPPGATHTFRVDQAGTPSVNVSSPANLRLSLEHYDGRLTPLYRWNGILELPPDALAVRAQNIDGEKVLPLLIMPEYPALPPVERTRVLASPLLEAQERWEKLEGAWAVQAPPARRRVRFAWIHDNLPPAGEVVVCGERTRLQWTRAFWAVAPKAPARPVWFSDDIETVGVPSVATAVEGLWMRWDKRLAPGQSLALHVPRQIRWGGLAPFLSRSWRATGLWVPEFLPSAERTSIVTYATPPEHRSNPAVVQVPDLAAFSRPAVPVGARDEAELTAKRGEWDGWARPLDVWRRAPAGGALGARIGDLRGEAKYGSLQIWWKDLELKADVRPRLEVRVDGASRLSEAILTSVGRLTVPDLPAGDRLVTLAVTPESRGEWRLRTIDFPTDDDLRVVRAWVDTAPPHVIGLERLPRVTQLHAQPLSAVRSTTTDVWTAVWLDWHPLLGWWPGGLERHWVLPGIDDAFAHESRDGARWWPAFRTSWRVQANRARTLVLFGPSRGRPALRVVRASSEPLPRLPFDQVRREGAPR
ncbi:MAG TPA: hypothetical protein VF950_04905 [Planctomycetota bacterium]